MALLERGSRSAESESCSNITGRTTCCLLPAALERAQVQRGRVLWACAHPAAPWDGSGKKRAPVGRGLGTRPGTVSARQWLGSSWGQCGCPAQPPGQVVSTGAASPLRGRSGARGGEFHWGHLQHTCRGLTWGPHTGLLPLLDPHASSACGAPVLGPAQRQREALRGLGRGVSRKAQVGAAGGSADPTPLPSCPWSLLGGRK